MLIHLKLYEVSTAIEYLHEQNFIHADIKGNNVLISDTLHALLGDFGLAKPTGADTSDTMKEAGSLMYKAPELYTRQKKTFASDMFAFGIMIAAVRGRLSLNAI